MVERVRVLAVAAADARQRVTRGGGEQQQRMHSCKIFSIFGKDSEKPAVYISECH